MRASPAKPMKYGAQYFYHTAFTVTTTLVSGILFYILRVVLYQNLAPDDYGLFYAVLSCSLVIYPFLSIGFDPGIVPYVTRFREDNDHEGVKAVVLGALVPQGVLAVALMALAVLFAEPIAATWFGTARAADIVRILAVYTCLLVPFRSGMGLLLGLQYIGARNLTDLARVAVCLGVAVGMLHFGRGLEAPALAYASSIAAGVLVAVCAAAMLRPAVLRARFRWKPGLVAEVFGSGKYLSLAFGGILIFSHMDTLMLTQISGDYRAIAAYHVAIPTVMIVYSLIFAGASNFMPMVTTLWYRGEKDLLADGVGRIYEAAAALILPGTVLTACFSDVLMGTLFRRDIMDAPDAFNVLAVGSLFLFTCFLNLHILAGVGRTRSAGTAIAWALGANILLNAVLIALLGIRGAALATVASHALATGLTFMAVRGELAIQIRFKALAQTVLVCACGALIALGLRRTSAFVNHPFLLAVCSAPALYALALAVLEAAGSARLRELVRIVLGGSP